MTLIIILHITITTSVGVIVPLKTSAESDQSIRLDDSKPRKIRVGFPDLPGLSETLPDGTYSGIGYDYLKKFRQYVNWDYEFIECTPEESITMLKNGEIDLLGSVLFMEEMLEICDYPAYSSGVSYTTLVTNSSNTHVDSYDYDSINGATVGVYNNAKRRLNDLRLFAESNGLEFKIRNYNDYDQYIASLQKGETDLILSGDVTLQTKSRIVAWFSPRHYYFVVSKGKTDIMRELNFAIMKLREDYSNIEQELYNNYFVWERPGEISLTDAEKDYIKSLPPIKATGSSNMAPFQYISPKTNQFKGISIDVLDNISKKTGLEFVTTPSTNETEAIQSLLDENTDMIIGALSTNALDDIYNLRRTVSYSTSVPLKVKHVDVPTNQMRNGGIRALCIDSKPQIDANDNRQNQTDIFFDTIPQCIQAIEKGIADTTIMNSHVAEYYMMESSSNRLSLVGSSETPSNIYFTLPHDVNPILLNVLNKAIRSLNSDSEDIQTIVYNNTTYAEHRPNLKRFIKTNPALILGLVIAVFLLAILVLITILTKRQHNAALKTLKKQQEYERNIRDALSSAQSATRAKSEFLSHISHEIRTPLTGIMGLTDMALRESNLPERVHVYLHKMKGSSNHLLDLINDILDMSRIESGRMKMEITTFNTSEFFQNVFNIISPLAQEKSLRFILEIESVSPTLKGDIVRIRQILLNLLSNSVKFTNPGGTVKLYITECLNDMATNSESATETDTTVFIRAVVSDDGIGMSEEFQENVFQPFEQENLPDRASHKLFKNSNNIANQHASNGTGLGLPITKNLVEMMHGHITLVSAHGKGTEISVTMCLSTDVLTPTSEKLSVTLEKGFLESIPDSSNPPTNQQDYQQNYTTDSYDFSSNRILLAEDNDINLEIELMLLESVGLVVDTASDGVEAVRMFKESPPGFYSAILMDILMPNLDGLEATKQIRSDTNHPDALAIPILAMTANAYSEDVARSFASGMNAHITKPISPADLYSKLQNVLQSKS